MKIGDRIRISRKINQINLKELSEYLGISVPTLRKIEDNQLFVNKLLVDRLIQNEKLNIDKKELFLYYSEQIFFEEVFVKKRNDKTYILIPKNISIDFFKDKNEIYCAYLIDSILISLTPNENYIFEKRKIVKQGYSFIFFSQKLKNMEKIKIQLDLKGHFLKIIFEK